MKIMVISQYYYPENFRINDICEELVCRGHEVTVLTGLPNYPSGTVPKEYKGNKRRKERRNGVNIIRCLESGRRKGAVGLACNYITFACSSAFAASRLKVEFDIIYIYQPSPIFSTIPAYILKRRYGKRIVLYCCDLWPESLKTYSILESSLLFRIMKTISRWLYQQCDCIAVTSPSFVSYLEKVHQIKKRKMVYLPQHAEELYTKMELQARKSDKVNFLFCGNIGKVQDVECIIRAAWYLRKRTDFVIHIVGDGSNYEYCKQLVKQKQLEQLVLFYGRHPIEEMPKFYALADVCLLTLKGNSFIGSTIPAKLQEYLSVGKPILAAINGSAKQIMVEAKCGICIEASNPKALANGIKQMIEKQELYKNYGDNGRTYFKQHFTKQIYIEKLEQLFERLV